MTGHPAAEIFKHLAAIVWAGVLLVAGLWLWRWLSPGLALAPIAAAQLVVMALVLDDLCPRARVAVVAPAKALALVVLVGSLVAWIDWGGPAVWTMLRNAP